MTLLYCIMCGRQTYSNYENVNFLPVYLLKLKYW